MVLALAGLRRLGRQAEVSEVLDADVLLPCPGQGALAVETRSGDPLGPRVTAALDHPATRAAVTAERSMLSVLDVGCSAPVGAWATVAGDTLTLRGALADDPVDLVADAGLEALVDGAAPEFEAAAAAPGLLALSTRGDATDAHAIGTRAGRELLRARAAAHQDRQDAPHDERGDPPMSTRPSDRVRRRDRGRWPRRTSPSWAPGQETPGCSRCAPPHCSRWPTWS